jgi:hypothetical protein
MMRSQRQQGRPVDMQKLEFQFASGACLQADRHNGIWPSHRNVKASFRLHIRSRIEFDRTPLHAAGKTHAQLFGNRRKLSIECLLLVLRVNMNGTDSVGLRDALPSDAERATSPQIRRRAAGHLPVAHSLRGLVDTQPQATYSSQCCAQPKAFMGHTGT